MSPLRPWWEGDLRTWFRREQRVAVHGLTGRAAAAQLPVMMAAGTNVVAGVAPAHGGEVVGGVPVFDDIDQARAATDANVSVMFLPAPAVKTACEEAVACGVRMVVVVTENVPLLDTVAIRERAGSALLVGPNSPGFAIPGVVKLGFMPSELVRPGPVGIVSRSGTLSYEVTLALQQEGLGISTWFGVGGDAVPFTDSALAALLVGDDPMTRVVVVIGEIGGSGEEHVAELIADGSLTVPVHALLVGQQTRGDQPMGHAGAVVLGNAGTFESKYSQLTAAGAVVHRTPWELAAAVAGSVAVR